MNVFIRSVRVNGGGYQGIVTPVQKTDNLYATTHFFGRGAKKRAAEDAKRWAEKQGYRWVTNVY